jgi:hypothetical protein
MIEPETGGPVISDVATFTAWSQLTLVWIVIHVAAAAIPRNFIVHVVCMTGCALEVLMTWRQCKIGAAAVIEIDRLPITNIVAALTVSSITTLVNIVAKVTGVAGAVFQVKEIFSSVTICAT